MVLRFVSEGELIWCLSMMEGDYLCGEGIEIDVWGLNLLNGFGDVLVGIFGFWVVEVMNGMLNGKLGIVWLFDVEDVGIGGENGRGGYCIDVCWFIDVVGEIVGGGGRGGFLLLNEMFRVWSLVLLSLLMYFF